MEKYKLRKKLLLLALVSGISSLTGCDTTELAPEEEYDVIGDDESGLENGLKQVLDVRGENFKLVAEYHCDDASRRAWRITSNKALYISMHTQGLSEDTEVYIDNIHIDTSIKSKYAAVDGILQDTMDDRIHNSLMIGFPISDNVYYYGVNAIEGCNETFIKGTFHGYQGYQNGTITEKRYTESTYINTLGVYANEIDIVIDLLIKGPNDKDYRNVSVTTDFLVNVSGQEIEYGYADDEKDTQKVKTK